jgi:hypothetical protein
VDDCGSVMSRQWCKKSEHCRWHFSRYFGDDGRCVWKSEEKDNNDNNDNNNNNHNNYSCSDMKRYNECVEEKERGDGNNTYKRCEYYKGRCVERCGLYSDDMERCKTDGGGYCVWQKKTKETTDDKEENECVLKVR